MPQRCCSAFQNRRLGEQPGARLYIETFSGHVEKLCVFQHIGLVYPATLVRCSSNTDLLGDEKHESEIFSADFGT
jgi:hypothetical protein